ncbi:MAG: hypothetical protein UHN41_06705 [Bacteroidales bacterium]|nr:hypothetical protein [Bacteroidales bacterium]
MKRKYLLLKSSLFTIINTPLQRLSISQSNKAGNKLIISKMSDNKLLIYISFLMVYSSFLLQNNNKLKGLARN